MNDLKFIDLFCGLGGIRLGFEKACQSHKIATTCMLSSDIKKAAVATYELNFSDKVSGDVSLIDSSNIPDFDILLGGFPCQAFSTAGKRLGFDDTRGTLFFEVARILRDKQPKAFLLENVEGLVSHGGKSDGAPVGKTFSTILNVLKDLGYSTEWKVLNAKNFGLPQSRNRVYIAGILGESSNLHSIFSHAPCAPVMFKDIREYGLPVKSSDFCSSVLKSHLPTYLQGKSINDKRGGSNNIHSWDLELFGEVSDQQKDLLSKLLIKRRYKKWATDNGTAWFDGIPLTLTQIKSFCDYPDIAKDLSDLVLKGYLKEDFPSDFDVNNVKIKRTDLPKGFTLCTGKLSFEFSKILDDNGITPTIVATDSPKLGVAETTGLRKLTAVELRRLFGFDDNYSLTGLSEYEIFDLFGNSVTVPVVRAIFDKFIPQIIKE